MYDVIIIGTGPAGVSAAIYAKSRGLNLVVLEKNKVGGTIGDVSIVSHYTGLIENESSESFAGRMRQQLEEAKIEIRYEEVRDVTLKGNVKKVVTNKESYEAKAIIIANGTTPRKLNVRGETQLQGKGYGMNAARDKEKYRNKNAYVIGGADGAIKEALYLSDIAKKVTVIHFESKLATIAQFSEQVAAKRNIKVMLNARIHQVIGHNEVKAIEVLNVINNHTKLIEDPGCGIFVYAGATPNSELYSSLQQKDGYIVCDENGQTSEIGVYAAGDICAKQVRQVASAVSDGAIAAINATNYIKS